MKTKLLYICATLLTGCAVPYIVKANVDQIIEETRLEIERKKRL